MGVSALLFALLVATGGAAPGQADDTTAAISGKWKGKYLESQGNRGEVNLELTEEAGKVTGLWRDTYKLENGRRLGDTLAWTMMIGSNPYTVHGIVSDGGRRFTLDFTFIDQMRGRLHKVTGIAVLQKE
jgi:hypothetical protein